MANKNKGNNKNGRGFAAMDEEKQREIASQGGKASHQSGKGREFSSEEAREAGQKGGQNSSNNRKNNDSDR